MAVHRVGKKVSVGKYTRTITGNEADEEETDDNGRVLIRKSSDDENDDENSSNSPPSNSKSILNTPINETIPLLMGDQTCGDEHSHPLKKTSKIPRYNRSNSNNSSFNKHSSISSPDEDERSEKFYLKKDSPIIQSNVTRGSWNKHDSRLAQSFGGGTYQSYHSTPPSSLQSRHSNVRRSTGSAGPMVTGIPSPNVHQKSETNKIRIKINQKN